MSRKTPTDEWGDLDSDDIASVASSELHAHRPNRWTGPASTWRNLTKDERMLWQSMERLRSEDLGVHLYNAFALKRQGREAEGRKFLTVKSEDGKESVWAPPKAWTAWPLKPNELPSSGLLKPRRDEYDHLTFSQPSFHMPSTDLQEEINAHILRFAKDRFRRRMARAKNKSQPGPIFASIEGPTPEAVLPSSPGSEVSYQSGRSDKRRVHAVSDMELDEEADVSGKTASRASSRSRSVTGDRRRQPQVSADDDLSEELLRAPVRHILTQLDKTLMILHHGRVALASHLDDSSGDDDEDDLASESGAMTPRTSAARRKRARSRSRSRPRSQSRSRPASQSSTPAANPLLPATSPVIPGSRPRGRPRKVHIPLEGETREEMALRIARQSHRPKPTTVARRDDLAFEAWLQQGEADAKRELKMAEGGRPTETAAAAAPTGAGEAGVEEGKGWREQKLDRLGLRDWSDVVGAATLAGFSDEVVERTVKRCVKLFGEGITMRRLEEVPLRKQQQQQQSDGIVERVYRPEEIELGESEVEDEDMPDIKATTSATASRRQSTSRRSSLGPRSAATTQSPTPSHARPRFPFPSTTTTTTTPPPILSRSRSRSRSRSATADLYCPEPTCPRASKGFDRRANLERHVRLVHGGRRLEDWEVDSDDDVVGGVRVDGFLREVVPEAGWFKKKRVRSRQVVTREVDDDEEEEEEEHGGFESE
ncbi:hypothetical protein NLU13_8017 [Sarocladium strictum]|uniref:C2H2-type domain-containing protein n=1 Tax=Sarocladium strictum TaxID=5046 RepID=A0AA39L486_SARSR|nr:hypothetical protein NLU13_8017 [Sarocladium strictum]